MRTLFADTSFFIALSSAKDLHHQDAHDFADSYRGQILTTDFVLVEVANHFSRADDRQCFPLLLKGLHRAGRIIVPASRELFQRGVELYVRRPDKNWSLTDCTSFVVMEEHALTESWTVDHHFEQAGFTILLK